MIRFVSPDLESVLIESCGKFGITDAKIYAQYQTYGAQSGLADFWLIQDAQEKTVGLVSRLDGRFTLAAAEGADLQELAWFLRSAGGRSVEGEQPLLCSLGLEGEHASGPILRQNAPEQPFQNTPQPGPPENLAEVFDLLCKADNDFARQAHYAAWLVETSHKLRHGLMQLYPLFVENTIVSTISILYLAPARSILAGVAVHPAYRGCGYGRAAVCAAARQSWRENRQPWVFAADDRLGGFYETCGFVPAGHWTRIDWKGNAR